jgi:cytochrome o ubiquinol oxidase operon protein cyoD
MHHEPNLTEIQKGYHGSLTSYFIGFTGSVILTMISFSLVILRNFSNRTIVISIAVLALVQAAVQLRYFLKLGYEAKPRWETATFGFMFLVLVVIVICSLWIMGDLDDRLMSDLMMDMQESHHEHH